MASPFGSVAAGAGFGRLNQGDHGAGATGLFPVPMAVLMPFAVAVIMVMVVAVIMTVVMPVRVLVAGAGFSTTFAHFAHLLLLDALF